MTRNEFIATTAARLLAASFAEPKWTDERWFQIAADDCVEEAEKLAAELEKRRFAPWRISPLEEMPEVQETVPHGALDCRGRP